MSAPYSRWQDSMFAQMGLLRWYQTSQGLRYLEGFYNSMNAKTSPEHRLDVRVLAGIHVRTLIEAEPVWVSEESCRLVDHARETFEPEPVLPTDPFVPCGFALFAEPLILYDAPAVPDMPGRSPSGKIPIRAVAWMPVHDEDVERGCFWIHHFVHVDDEGDEHNSWSPEEREKVRQAMPLSLAHTFQWTWGEAPWRHPERLEHVLGEDIAESQERARMQSQLMQTLWRIGSQFVPAKARAERQMRRQAKRHKMTKGDEVTVIRLRRSREYEEREEPTGRELSVQFLVRGYWAIRHTREGPRQTWVTPHVKGPPDAPFKETKRAWEFTR